MELIKLVKTQLYYLVFNIIVFVYMLTPYVSVKVVGPQGIEDISVSFACKYLFSKLLYADKTKKKYQVHLKTFDKIFIINTSIYQLINSHHTIRESSEKLNPPRSLFIKYDILVNNKELSIDQKVFFKKYADGTKIVDMLEFNGIILSELKVLKNNKDFKLWDLNSNLEELTIEQIYPYL